MAGASPCATSAQETRGSSGLRHPPCLRAGHAGLPARAAPARHRPAYRQPRPGGRPLSAPVAWRGVIEEYREHLPVGAKTPVVSLLEGSTPLLPRPPAVRARRGPGVAEGRRGEPDRLVQGPRHDGGHLQGPRGRGQGRRLRVDRQHVGVRRRLRGAGRAGLRRAHPRRLYRARQTGPGPGPRRPCGTGEGELRPRPGARAGAGGKRACHGRQLHKPLPDRRSEDRALSRSSTCSATAPTSTACPSATPATSPPTGRATGSTRTPASSSACRGCSGSRPPAPPRSCSATRWKNRKRSPRP